MDEKIKRQEDLKDKYQKIITEKDRKAQKRLGAVFTPTEVVDFMLESVNEILKKEFGRDLSCEDVKIIDPFSGTGVFTARLIDKENLISDEALESKYDNDIEVNEIMELTHDVGVENIEESYYQRTGKRRKFKGSSCVDTFTI